jgi:hypothetical protein
MDLRHTDSDAAEAADLRETRRRFLLAREQASQCSADLYGAVRKLRDWPVSHGGRPMTTDGDVQTA